MYYFWSFLKIQFLPKSSKCFTFSEYIKNRYVKIYCTYTKIKSCMQKYIHVHIPVSYNKWEYPVIIHYKVLVIHFLFNMSNDLAHLICSPEEPHTKKTFHQTFLTFSLAQQWDCCYKSKVAVMGHTTEWCLKDMLVHKYHTSKIESCCSYFIENTLFYR